MRAAPTIVLAALLAAAPAAGQDAAAPSAPLSPPAADRDFSPFLEPGFDDGRRAPRTSDDALGPDRRGIGSSTEFGLDALMTPGTRGAKRSLKPRARSPFDAPSDG